MRYRHTLARLLAFTFVTVMAIGLLVRTVQGHQQDNAQTYSALFLDATKVIPGNDVRLAGVTVGRIETVSLTSTGQARVRFNVDGAIHLTTDTTARIRYRNLVGERYLALDVPVSGSRLPHDGTIGLDHTTPALDLTAVFNGFRPLFQGLDASSINTLSLSLVQALQGEGGTIASLLDSTGTLGTAIGKRDATIGALVTDLAEVLGSLNDNSDSFNSLITHLRDLSTGLHEDQSKIVDALGSIDQLATATNTLLSQARPDLKSVIASTGIAAARLEEHKGKLDEKMKLLPVKLNALMRAAQYGSWFQFFNCGIGMQIDLAGGAPPLVAPPNGPSTGICSP